MLKFLLKSPILAALAIRGGKLFTMRAPEVAMNIHISCFMCQHRSLLGRAWNNFHSGIFVLSSGLTFLSNMLRTDFSFHLYQKQKVLLVIKIFLKILHRSFYCKCYCNLADWLENINMSGELQILHQTQKYIRFFHELWMFYHLSYIYKFITLKKE